MGLFFDAEKYLTRVESPRIDTTKDRRDQINDYIVRYFEMYSHDYIQKAEFSARIYVNEVLPDNAVNTEGLTTPEVQAISVITQVIQDFAKNSLDDFHYQKPLAAQEAFRLYCAMMSKLLELGIINKKLAEKSIEAFYKNCDL
ncbi:MAG: hypothetical protein J6N21_09080 [Butyrivibrio sp.]|nr:hypothetical protein [Butyrivibrio sp.]